MWFWDFTPSSHWYRKPISKRDLKKLQENFAMADEISAKARKLELDEKKKASQEFDDLLDEIV
ncbi:MAG: hypothetical protein ACD_4C00466G0002 [uncultured bacterium (gcode 4)]|uniref:Uncharacterized protein n=1 Tax=uncultured bacterium (gcode 4) TaxID=1234023 RepID=K2FT10_9BACT|nr:MAG: hypothetical protein ACD_4C00466G0002 [uncultured bacterium (gcode 4)]